MPSEPSIAICCSTFHRHDGLVELLRSLFALEFTSIEPRITIVVVNNDPEDERPKDICEHAQADSPYPIEYLVEPKRGLSHPRNRALDHTRSDYDFIAFIDDDSTAASDWLQQLLKMQADLNADVVTGPVAPVFEETPPRWITNGGFFAPESKPNGKHLDRAYTNNVLIDNRIIQRSGARFEPSFALIGGEDTFFFRTLVKTGASIVWCADALVNDAVPKDRATKKWLVMRHERTGMCSVEAEKRLHGHLIAYPLVLAKGAVWFILASALMTVGIAGGKAMRIRALCWFAWGRGLWKGAIGRQYEEYLHER